MQQDLLDLGGELSIPGHTLLRTERVASLDDWLAKANATLPRLQEFIRPDGSVAAAQASNTLRQYLNRLSDLMFVMARVLNRAGGGQEHQWDRTRNA